MRSSATFLVCEVKTIVRPDCLFSSGHLPFYWSWIVSDLRVVEYRLTFMILLCRVYFQSKYDLDPAQAKIVNSLIYTISAFASPAFGFMIDRTGRNLTWTLFAVLSTIGTASRLKDASFEFVTYAFSISLRRWPCFAGLFLDYSLRGCGELGFARHVDCWHLDDK